MPKNSPAKDIKEIISSPTSYLSHNVKINKSNTKFISAKVAFAVILMAVVSVGLCSCNDSKSYAELLTKENHSVNNFLADQRVINTIPTDTNFVFETGENAPYYRLDEDGNMYMQVVDPGTPGNYAKDDQIIYFRYMRYNIDQYADGELPPGEGNSENMGYNNSWFRYNNFSLESSYRWGTGVQMPLKYLPIDCKVNIIIKSQYGFYEEMAYVVPFLYTLRYFPQMT